MKIGFAGLGVMGGPMARHLVKAGHELAGYNRSPAKAQAWAEQMARTGQVSHSNLRDGAPGFRYLGENVGWARSVGEMHSLFMASSSHRATIVSGRYTKVGTGVAIVNGRYYVVQVFGG